MNPVLKEKAKLRLWKSSMDEVLFVIKNDIDNQIKAVEVEFVEHHKSGSLILY